MVSWVELEIEIGRFSERKRKSLETNGFPPLCKTRRAGRCNFSRESLGLGEFSHIFRSNFSVFFDISRALTVKVISQKDLLGVR